MLPWRCEEWLGKRASRPEGVCGGAVRWMVMTALGEVGMCGTHARRWKVRRRA